MNGRGGDPSAKPVSVLLITKLMWPAWNEHLTLNQGLTVFVVREILYVGSRHFSKEMYFVSVSCLNGGIVLGVLFVFVQLTI